MAAPMKVQRRRYKKRLKASERREEVLDSALSLITRTGVFQVTMADVAAEGGVSKPIVYDYFANADQLLAALIKRQGERALAVIEQVLPEPASLPAGTEKASFLADRLGLYLRSVQEDPDLWRLTLSPPDGMTPVVRARIEKEREAARVRILGLLEWSLAGAGRGLDLELLSHAIHAVVQRLARLIIAEPDRYTPERVVTAVRKVATLRARK
jgi:AcrR family transcriptional regulator